MSFILDALKKSEAERQRQAGPALLEMRVMRPQRRIAPWLLIVGGALIVLNLAGMLWLFLRPAPPAAQVPTAAVANGAATTPAAATGARAGASANAPAIATNPDGTPVLAPGERLIGPGVDSGAVAQVPMLAGDAANGATAPPLTLPTQLPGADFTGVDPGANPADYVPAGPSTTRTPTASLRSYNDVSGRVPAMRLDLHVYDASPSRRYAFINMKKVREGDVTAEGGRVLEITRDGVIVDYRSTEFLLTSDSSAPAASAAP